MKAMADKVSAMLPEDFGFTLLVFKFNNPGESNYISNANRQDMIKALRETADRLEKQEDYPTPEDNIYS